MFLSLSRLHVPCCCTSLFLCGFVICFHIPQLVYIQFVLLKHYTHTQIPWYINQHYRVVCAALTVPLPLPLILSAAATAASTSATATASGSRRSLRARRSVCEHVYVSLSLSLSVCLCWYAKTPRAHQFRSQRPVVDNRQSFHYTFGSHNFCLYTQHPDWILLNVCVY